MSINFPALFSLISASTKSRFFNVRPRFSSSYCVNDYIDENSEDQAVLLKHQIHVPDASNFYKSLLSSSTHMIDLKQIHAQFIISGLHTKESFLVSEFMNACLRIGEIGYARQVFDAFPQPNISMWNAIVGGYSKSNMLRESIETYAGMKRAGVSPDYYILTQVLKACSLLKLLQMGGAIHGHICRLGHDSNMFVQSGLVSLYAECGRIDYAKKLVSYDGLLCSSRSIVVSWTAIISKCAQSGNSMEALRLFSDMRMMKMKPDWITLVSVLRACADLDYLEQGKSLHGCVLKMGLVSEEDLQISLTAMYAKCGEVMVARYLFDQINKQNLILWNAMISGYAKNGYAEKAVELFKLLAKKKDMKPDSITLRAAILACAQVGSIDLARWMNDYVSRSDYQNHVYVKTALVDMFSKCGTVEVARQVFNKIRDKDVVVWSAMIVGYGLHGCGREAIDLYDAMVQAEVMPNDVTFLGLLLACKNSGLVREGWTFFHSMKDYGIEPLHQHYACVVDLLGRAGYLAEAYKFIVRMPMQPGITVWGALLSACKIHRHVQMGEYAASKVFAIDPNDTGHYVQLSNLYAAARMWDQVNEIRKLMKERGLSKDFGFSLIEINGKLQVFRVGDNSHPRYEEIWKKLADLERRLKEAGFSPDSESNLHDLSSEDMQESLCNHSERLAVACGLISTPSGSTLRITKNLRACVNCHSAIKLISKFTNREIIIRDANRFHHFKDGVCSCGDYW
ncbi:pentatricopeptide repeat-containing protein At3g12770-like [Chenopodium quinoa]|uniref:DYW domain-containing protein n=1 Tax=Chenopodium quinoa TaxID=63459 RepID=A0A803M0U9_CHEQI|nr:pentatricopeptide repeat-containing protein At3g12770-like [Chenopodium quinoa]